MIRFKSNIPKSAAVIGVLLLALFFYALSFRSHERMPWHQQVVVAVISPVQNFITSIGRGTVNIWNRYFYLVGLSDRVDELQNIVSEQGYKLREMEEIKGENTRLRNLLEFSEMQAFDSIGAKVVANDPRSDFRVITLNRGNKSGVSINDTVLSSNGLVGKIVDVGNNTSRALLITDPNNAVDVLVQRSRARALLTGATTDIDLQRGHFVSRLEYLMRQSDIKDGDVIVTSGFDEIFPAGVPVGSIQGVKNDESGIFRKAEVVPFTDFTNLEEVLIVRR